MWTHFFSHKKCSHIYRNCKVCVYRIIFVRTQLVCKIVRLFLGFPFPGHPEYTNWPLRCNHARGRFCAKHVFSQFFRIHRHRLKYPRLVTRFRVWAKTEKFPNTISWSRRRTVSTEVAVVRENVKCNAFVAQYRFNCYNYVLFPPFSSLESLFYDAIARPS